MTTEEMVPLLSVHELHKRFAARRSIAAWLARRPATLLAAVDGVSLQLARGKILGLAGESGSGKTTLARCLNRLLEPDGGTISFEGVDVRGAKGADLRELRRRMQMVFQDPYASLNPRMSIGDAILEAGRVHHRPGSEDRHRFVADHLEMVGLSAGLANQHPRHLSGGQRQRAAIARALSVGPDLLIADEAVSALDVSIQTQLLNLFLELRSELGLAIIFVAHQLSVIAEVADRVAIMYRGRIVEEGPITTVFGSPEHPYTRALLYANPDPDPHKRMKLVASGEPAQMLMPGGCRFRDRCAYEIERCHTDDPMLELAGGGHLVACHVRPFRPDSSAQSSESGERGRQAE